MTYYKLTKPGIIRGNLMTALAGFMFAAGWGFKPSLLAGLLAGTTLVIASGCVFNNYLDRKIDARMDRTKDRAIPSGAVSLRAALIYATMLGMTGFSILILFTNWLTFLAGLIGLFFYVVVYGYYKRRSHVGTLVGGVSGSMSIVAGYLAASGYFDGAALLLFLIMAVWQMPHFYAIGIYRLDDYASADLPILPVIKGLNITIRQIIVYIGVFTPLALLLAVFGYAGYSYFIVMSIVGLYWFHVAVSGVSTNDPARWAGRVFGVSLLTLTVFSLMLSINYWLP